ncbi:hypothetical protein AB2B38_001095 [Balneola sp. MJW-20]|uniref:hypothetical protein n=1 Tax=Gracilimonas aurantiaca TaxID=3234185 RepID=UPI0034672344
MSNLKNLAVDLIALISVIILYYSGNEILNIVIWVYSVLLLIGKISALFMPYLQQKAKKTEAPEWVYHLIYAATTGVLIYGAFYYLSLIWIVVWILSTYISFSRNKKMMADS